MLGVAVGDATKQTQGHVKVLSSTVKGSNATRAIRIKEENANSEGGNGTLSQPHMQFSTGCVLIGRPRFQLSRGKITCLEGHPSSSLVSAPVDFIPHL